MSGTTAFWYASRATGIVALLLLTAVLVLGILVNRQGRLPGLPRFAVTSLHRNISLLAVAFIAVHVVTAVLDTFVSIPLASSVIPFDSGYERLWLGLGAISFDLMLAMIITSLVRGRLNRILWRAIHLLAYLCWPVAFAHSIGSSSDLQGGWLLGLSIGTGRHDQALARQPWAGAGIALPERAHRGVHAIGGLAQRQLAQCRQVGRIEKILQRPTRLRRQIDLAGAQSRQQILGRQINQLDFIGLLEHPVGNGLLLTHSGNAGDQIVKPLEVLDVDGGPHADAGPEQFIDVLPALGVPRRRLAVNRVGMRVLIDQQHRRVAGERGIQVKFLQHDIAIPHRQGRQHFQPDHQPLGLLSAMRLHVTDHHLRAGLPRAARGLEHGVRLADARSCAEENPQLAAPGAAVRVVQISQQLIGIRPGTVLH